MTQVVKGLLLCLGVNPPVFEVDEDVDEVKVLKELQTTVGEIVQLPAVFVGGKLLGGLDKVMASHITGELVPILKQAGALWL
ncbi:GRXC9 [Linum perenne]